MGEHTPGPWEVRELLVDGLVIRKHGTYEIRTPDYDVASDVPGGGPFRKLADARLAAAAPELLTLIEKAEWGYRDTCLYCHCSSLSGHAEDCERQATLAKAKDKAR